MPNRFNIDNFEPRHLKEANTKLDKHILSANAHKKRNDEYRKHIFHESLWRRFMALFGK